MSKRKTKEEWQLESNFIHNCEFEIIDDPKSGQDNVNILHKKCGNIISMKLNNHLKRYCKYCSNKNKKTREDWQVLSNSLHNNEFIILSDVNNGKEKVNILHKKCGNIISMTMNNHINHLNGCKKCAKNSLKSNDYWVNKCKDIWDSEYTLLENVNNVHKKIKIRHNSCGRILMKSMNNFVHNKRGCRYCSETTYGEDYIKKFLDKNNIRYIQQKTFDKLINPITNRKLRVDFYLCDENIALEIDGVQHYKSIGHWGGQKEFEKQIYRDGLKNEFFKQENIKLIRINNKKIKDIEKILWRQ